MYLAELHGKISQKAEYMEDVLTSNVFSFFKYANRKAYLKPFLSNLGFDISVEEAEEAEFRFWPCYDDHTEPDVVIEIGKYYLLFEAKFFSDFGKETSFSKDQLTREIEGGKAEAKTLNKIFWLIPITRDYNEPRDKFSGVCTKCNFKWINWQTISSFLLNTFEKGTKSDEAFAQDLYALLVKKDLRMFESFGEMLPTVSIRESDHVFFSAESASYRGGFIGFTDTLPNTKIFNSERIFLDHPRRGEK